MTTAFRRTFVRAFALVAFAIVTLLGSATAHAIVVRAGVAFRPVARMAVRTTAVVGAAAVTAAAVGSMVYALPPSCASMMVGNVAYQQCGNTWYQPQYAGSQVQYQVVNPPQ